MCILKKLIIAISGSSGVIYGIRLLQILKETANIQTHLIISNAAKKTIELETNLPVKKIEKLSNIIYNNNDIAASISSGSFNTYGMIILPCSIKTLSGIANSYNDNLIIRAADVTLKERKILLLAIRETPLHTGHLRLLLRTSKLGAIIYPLTTAFYCYPKNINDIINYSVNRILDFFNIKLSHDLFLRWK
ncbi:MAG: UbiX family flavin prenyltransferase [Candidatus Lightella neohaematopini]|nr:UbiX family flavin prenyltransferase [Candidatus Lightella neohaematopini]